MQGTGRVQSMNFDIVLNVVYDRRKNRRRGNAQEDQYLPARRSAKEIKENVDPERSFRVRDCSPEHRRVFNQRRKENEEALEAREALLRTVDRHRGQRDPEQDSLF